MTEYIIINKTAVQKRIEQLEKRSQLGLTDEEWNNERGQEKALKQILSQSTPLIPEIDKAIEFGKDIRREKSFINNNYGSPFVDYEDSTEETINYISNLKLDI